MIQPGSVAHGCTHMSSESDVVQRRERGEEKRLGRIHSARCLMLPKEASSNRTTETPVMSMNTLTIALCVVDLQNTSTHAASLSVSHLENGCGMA